MRAQIRDRFVRVVPYLGFVGAGGLGLLMACSFLGEGRPHVDRQSWWDGRGPVISHESFPSDCSLCHEGEGWNHLRKDFTFDHAAETGVELAGAHNSAECLRCHNDRGPVSDFAARGCAGCHEDIHRGQLGSSCETCHENEDRWSVNDAIAQHDATRFPLIGAHAAAACWRCHQGAQVGVFARADTSCETCHQDDLARAVDPDHMAMGFARDCEQCHVPVSWTGASFVHAFFPLTAGHAGLDCTQCHTGGSFLGTPTACSACHLDDYQGALDPNHVMFSLPLACDQCHSTTTWDDAFFQHAGITAACVQCHLADYQATSMPDHAASGYPTSCEDCHGTNTWQGAVFNHPPINRDDHSRLDCTDCHTVPTNFSMFTCTDCHEHTRADMDDDHSRVTGYMYVSSACYQCHPTSD